MDFLEIRKRAQAQRQAAQAAGAQAHVEPSPEKPPEPAQVRTETAREALEALGLPMAPAAPVVEPVEQIEPAAEETPATPAGDPLEEFFFRSDEAVGELEELAAGLEPAAEAPEEEPREYLGFSLAGEEYAVELERIREIVRVPQITEVPRAPADISGVMSLRGEVMPVFDLRKRLRLPAGEAPSTKRARVVVVDVGDGPEGILVDAVDQVVRLRPSTIEPPPPGLGGLESECLCGIGRLRDRMFVLLNLPAVLARPSGLAGERR
jgi:purine-binding chemotaxis protein CheW